MRVKRDDTRREREKAAVWIFSPRSPRPRRAGSPSLADASFRRPEKRVPPTMTVPASCYMDPLSRIAPYLAGLSLPLSTATFLLFPINPSLSEYTYTGCKNAFYQLNDGFAPLFSYAELPFAFALEFKKLAHLLTDAYARFSMLIKVSKIAAYF